MTVYAEHADHAFVVLSTNQRGKLSIVAGSDQEIGRMDAVPLFIHMFIDFFVVERGSLLGEPTDKADYLSHVVRADVEINDCSREQQQSH